MTNRDAEALSSLPIIRLSTLYHVGTLDIANKKPHTFEGTGGLSVSTEPDAWRRINRGQTFGDTHRLTKKTGLFLDASKLEQEQLDSLMTWGVQNELLCPCQQYSYSYFDDEMEEDLTFYFDSEAEAEAESEGEHEIIKVDSFKGSNKFAEIVGHANKDNLSLITVAFCLMETNLDGVYWDAEVDVLRYTAPRGIILQNKLNEWTTQIGC